MATSKLKSASAGRGAAAKRKLDETALANCRRILNGGMAKSLGLRMTRITPRKLVGEMKVLPRHTNFNGGINGGAIMAFADLIGAMGAALHRPPGYRGGTIESKTNFLAQGKGATMTGECVPLHVGRTTSVWQTTVKNADGRPIAVVTQTQVALPADAGV